MCVGTAFREIKGKFFPSVGMKKAGEQVRVNFGQSPFIFDIDGLMEVSLLIFYSHVRHTSCIGCIWQAFEEGP